MCQDNRAGRVSQAQMMKLLELLSEKGVLVNGRVVYKNTNRQAFWKSIALQLNNIDNGVHKNVYKWCKMWADWKNKTKKKADTILSKKKLNLNQIPSFTKLEFKLLKMINYPVNELLHCLNMEIESHKEVCNKNDRTNEDQVGTNSDDLKDSGDEETSGLKYFRINSILNNQNEDTHILLCNEKISLKIEQDNGNNETAEDGTLGDCNNSEQLGRSKLKTIIDLEKETIHQKNEELRLKALELKLKGDELKLKEIEVNKVNYLTKLEEEKLKCMKDISLTLKELLEWTKNSNTRFHNVM